MSIFQIRFKADRFTGEVVMHCHILPHEDIGMMMTVDITDKGFCIDLILVKIYKIHLLYVSNFVALFINDK